MTMTMTLIERAVIVQESDAVCVCGADPRERTGNLEDWFVDEIVTEDGAVAQVRCPACW